MSPREDQLPLFNLDQDEEHRADSGDDCVLELRADDSAWTSCRHCQTLTTAAGITRRGHGPDSVICRRMLDWPPVHTT